MANGDSTDDLTILWSVSQALEEAAPDAEVPLARVLEGLREIGYCRMSAAFVAEPAGGVPRLVAYVGLEPGDAERLEELPSHNVFAVAAGLAGGCFRLADVDSVAAGTSQSVLPFEPSTAWCIPLSDGAAWTGQLVLAGEPTGGAHVERDRLTRCLVGRLVSAGIARGRSLRETREQTGFLDQLLANLPVPVFYKDRAGTFLGCNRAFEEFIGAERAKVVGHSAGDIAPPELANRYAQQDAELLASPDVPRVSRAQVRRYDGELRSAQVHKAALRSARGEVVGLVGAMLDTTELDRQERLLRLSERRLGVMVELNDMSEAPEADLLQFAMDAAIVLTNSRVGLLGLLNDEAGRVDILFSSEATEDCATDETKSLPFERTGLLGEAVRQQRAVVVNDYRAPHPAKIGLPRGHVSIERLLSVPVVAEGSVKLLIGLANKDSDYDDLDAAQTRLLGEALWSVLDRRRRGDELRRSEERLQQLLERLPAGVVVVDPETHTIVHVNPAAALLIGLPAEEIIGRVCHQFICPALEGKCPVTDLGRSVDNSERVLVRADGARIPIMKTVVTIHEGGRELLLEAFVDVAELKSTQQALEASEGETRELARKLQAENDRLNREMTLAAAVQRSAVPERVCVEGLCSAFHFRPSGRVGGDFLGYVRERDGTGLVYIGDVSGHGLPSAVAVTAIVEWIQDVAEPGVSPSEFLAALQEIALPGLEASGLYATLCVGRFDSTTGEFCCASAGHPWPLRLGAGGPELVRVETGAPLGLLAEFSYPERVVTLDPGEGLLLYSDGLLDACDSRGERLGIGRVSEWCADARNGSPCGTLEKVIGSWRQALGSREPDDDVTALALHRVAISQHLVESGDELPCDVAADVATRTEAAGFGARESADILEALDLALGLARRSRNVAHSARLAYGFSPGCFHAVVSLNDRRRVPSFGHPRRTPPPPPETAAQLAALRSLVTFADWRPSVGDVFLMSTCAPPGCGDEAATTS